LSLVGFTLALQLAFKWLRCMILSAMRIWYPQTVLSSAFSVNLTHYSFRLKFWPQNRYCFVNKINQVFYLHLQRYTWIVSVFNLFFLSYNSLKYILVFFVVCRAKFFKIEKFNEDLLWHLFVSFRLSCSSCNSLNLLTPRTLAQPKRQIESMEAPRYKIFSLGETSKILRVLLTNISLILEKN